MTGDPVVEPRRRATWLLISDVRLLDSWARNVTTMFNGEVPYLVGSATERHDYRDVDVRLILDDRAYARLAAEVNVRALDVAVSLWGQKVTGLPIDFQVQQMTAANEEHRGRRHALGIGEWP